MTKKALVLLSGGQDSVTCLAQALGENDVVEALGINYGQRHLVELQQAQMIADAVGVKYSLVDSTVFTRFTHNSLTDLDMEIDDGDELPNTFVPGRNALFLNIAGIYAYQRDIRRIYIGVCEADYSGYPDCRENFVQSMQESLSLAMDTQFEIRTPLMHLSKAETVVKMKELGHLDLLALSHTCYEGDRPACGKCPACILRLNGFEEAGLTDPLAYRS